MRSALALALAASTIALARPARADVVPPAPSSCPAGSLPESAHGGGYCAPIACSTDVDCAKHKGRSKEPLVCKMSPLCVGTKKVTNPRTKATRDTPTATECNPKCGASQTTCEVMNHCVPASYELPAGGCRCDLAASPAGPSALAALLGAALALAARRGRRTGADHERSHRPPAD